MFKQTFIKQSLYTTLGTIIVATVILVMSLNLVINHIQITDRLTSELEKNAHQTALHLAQNIAPFMESYAVEEYDNLIENETDHKDLLAIIVSDRNMAKITGDIEFKTGFIQTQLDSFSEYHPDNKDHNDILKNCYFSDQHPIISANGDTIGSVTLYVSDQKIRQALNELLFNSLINMLIISFTLTIFLFLAIRYFLLAPLYKTISLIEQTDEAGIPIQEIKVSGSTEMTKLSQTINTMLHTIKASKKALEHSAKHDSLTGLPNRYLFNEFIQNVMHRCDRNNHIMALLYLDLDGFKEVNDILGHEAGDKVLINVAHPLKAALLRKEDIVARIGGDEFVIAIADLRSKKELIPVLNRLLTDLHQTIPYEKDGVTEKLEVTASIGVTIYPQQSPVDADHLLRQADEAMYHAKNTGRNQYFFYDELPKYDSETPAISVA